MIEVWGVAVPDMEASHAAVVPQVGEDRTVSHLEQGKIDRMMPSARREVTLASSNGFDVAADDRGANGRAHVAPAAEATGMAAEPAIASHSPIAPALAIVGATALAHLKQNLNLNLNLNLNNVNPSPGRSRRPRSNHRRKWKRKRRRRHNRPPPSRLNQRPTRPPRQRASRLRTRLPSSSASWRSSARRTKPCPSRPRSPQRLSPPRPPR